MSNYLVVYRTENNRIKNAIVSWEHATAANIDIFESTIEPDDYVCVINIIKLEN